MEPQVEACQGHRLNSSGGSSRFDACAVLEGTTLNVAHWFRDALMDKTEVKIGRKQHCESRKVREIGVVVLAQLQISIPTGKGRR